MKVLVFVLIAAAIIWSSQPVTRGLNENFAGMPTPGSISAGVAQAWNQMNNPPPPTTPSKKWYGPSDLGWNSNTQCPIIRNAPSATVDACKIACEGNSQCNSIAKSTQTDECYLYNCPAYPGVPSNKYSSTWPFKTYSTFDPADRSGAPPPPPPPSKTWYGPSDKSWTQAQCTALGGDRATSNTFLDECKSMCEQTPPCNAIDYQSSPEIKCFLRWCPSTVKNKPPTHEYASGDKYKVYATFPIVDDETPEPPPSDPSDPDSPPNDDPGDPETPPPSDKPPKKDEPTFYEKNKNAIIIGSSVGGGVLLLLIVVAVVVAVRKKQSS